MKATITIAIAIMAASALLSGAAEVDGTRIPTLRLGKCSITVLDSNGIKPLAGATLALHKATDGKPAVSAVANPSGLCEITVAEGRYILSVNEKPITLINASKDGQLAWARIVVSETPMLIGGQEGATEETFTYLGLTGPQAVTAAVAAGLVSVGAGGAIIYHNSQHGSGKPTPPTEQQDEPTPPPVSL